MDTSPSTTATYDALGRMVEKAVGTTYTQIVYSPLGGKIAVMSGQTLQKGFIPLPTGATAVYTSSGLAYYRHTDHLGSARLATTPSQTLYSSTAYAPFGEPYKQAPGTTDVSFTGEDQDTASGMQDTLFRKYLPVQGRWLTPDPAGIGAVDPGSPQTWNRYAYVTNSPLSFVDPLGLQIIYDQSGCWSDDDLKAPAGVTCGGGVSSDPCFSYGLNCSGQGPGGPPSGPGGGGGGNSGAANNGTPNPTFFFPPKTCTGTARVLGGNPATVGQQGGVPGTLVAPGGAAAIPRQFGFRTGSGFSGQPISGTVGYTGPLAFPGMSQSFSGVTDTIGSSTVPNVQNFLMKNNPGALILELVTGSDMGKVPVQIQVPASMSCPAGTS